MDSELLLTCLTAASLLLVILVAISGNILLSTAVLSHHSLRRQAGNLYIVSLSLTDLTLALLVMSPALVNDLFDYWPLGLVLCDVWVACDVMLSTASILNLCAISFDRYIHIKDPLRYASCMTRTRVLSSICGVWVVAFLLSFVPILLGHHRPAVAEGAGSAVTEESQCALELSPQYALVSSTISFFLPCLVMLFMYSRLYLYARAHIKQIRAMSCPVTRRPPDDENMDSHVHQRARVSESKAAVTVGVIVGVFLVCYVPFFCVNVVAAFCANQCVPRLAFQVLTWCGYLNSAFNPIIYSVFHLVFRHAFARTLGRWCDVCCFCFSWLRCLRSAQPPSAQFCARHSEYHLATTDEKCRHSPRQPDTMT